MDISRAYVGQQVWFDFGVSLTRYVGTISAVYYNSLQCGVAVPGEPFPFILNASQLTPAALQFQPGNISLTAPPGWPDDEITLVSEIPTKSVPADDRYPHACPRCGGAAYIGLATIEHMPGLDYCQVLS